MPEEYKSRIEELKKRLYSRTNKPKEVHLSGLKETNFDVKNDWSYENTTGIDADGQNMRDRDNMTKKRQHSFLNKALIISLVFLLGAMLYALFSFGTGQGTISSRNIIIKVSGPISVSAGETLSLELDIKNNNNVNLELADLLVEYPEGTREAENLSTELKRYRKSLGDIPSDRRVQTTIDSVLFGEEGEEKTISIGVEYRIPGSNAIFFVEKKYKVKIISSPLSMNVDSPTSVNAGEEIEFVLNIVPNSTDSLERILVVAEYPFGFKYDEESGTKPTFDNNIWEIKKLEPGDKTRIVIRGIMLGQDDEERTFRFVAGLPKEFDEKIIGTPFLTHTRSITIERPFLGVSLALNGNTAESVSVGAGSDVRADIVWQNNLPSKVLNVLLEVSLQGEMIDRSSVSGGRGFFRSTDDTIVWDSRSIGEFYSLGARSSGSTSFSFNTLDVSSVSGKSKDPRITLVARISGESSGEGGAPERIVTTITKEIVVSTKIDLTARAYYFRGPFINSGPLPPKVDQETTYTIVLSVSNAINDVTGAKARLTLPAYIRWLGVTSPGTESISYSAIGGEVVWDIGVISSGVGYNSPTRDVSFQIAIVPSLSQVGESPSLIQNPRLEGRDTLSDIQLSDTASNQVTTRITSDSGFKSEYGIVVE